MEKDNGIILRVFAYRKRDLYFACCLDLNLVSQGQNVDEALHNLGETVTFFLQTELEEGKTFEQIRRSPPLYFRIKFSFIVLRVLLASLSRRVSDQYRFMLARFSFGKLDPFTYLTA